MKENVLRWKSQFVNRLLVVVLHVVAAGTFIFLPLMVFNPRMNARPPRLENFRSPFPGEMKTPQISDLDFHGMRMHSILFSALLVAFFYFNMYFLVPRILTKKSVVHYVATIVICFAIIFLFNEGIVRMVSTSQFRPGRPVYFTVINFLLVFGLSTALRLTRDRVEFERERKERETENLKSELSLLRSQVSPHFMFNVLNNLASLARKKSDQLEPVIIQLSHLMRYMLYDSGEKKVSLAKEIEYLESYIDLQKLRFGNDVTVAFETDITKGDMPIEPMLLIPFVENAFKHGIGIIMDPVISIQLVTDETTLHFTVKNKFSSSPETKDPSSGIGVQNVSRRLDLLYKDMHDLKIHSSGEWFIVELKLILR